MFPLLASERANVMGDYSEFIPDYSDEEMVMIGWGIQGAIIELAEKNGRRSVAIVANED